MSMKYSDVKALSETVFSDDIFDDAVRTHMKYEGRSAEYIEDTIQKRKGDIHYADGRYSVSYGEWDVPRINNGLGFRYSTPSLINPELLYIVPNSDLWKYSYMKVQSDYAFYIDKDTSEMLEFEVRISASQTGFSEEPVVEE